MPFVACLGLLLAKQHLSTCAGLECLTTHIAAAQGVVGEGYTRVLNGEAHTLPNDGTFYGNPDDYLLPHYFPANVPATHKSPLPSGGAYRRHLMARVQAQDDITLATEGLDSDDVHIGRAGGEGGENVLEQLYVASAGGN